MKFSLVEIYPEVLSSSGDSGNAQTVAYRLRQRGHEVTVASWNGETEFPSADAVFIGNGPWSAANRVREAVLTQTVTLRKLRDDGVPICAIGTGAELLGRVIIDATGTELSGAGVFDLVARRDADRRVGYMRVDTPAGELIGFGDFASEWICDVPEHVIGSAIVGDRPNSVFSEGCRVEASIATRMGGPLLPLNPALADEIIATMAARRSEIIHLTKLAIDDYIENARQLISKNVDSVFTTIALS